MASVCAQPKILGILNVTPDSFSDGGRYWTPSRAIEHFDRLLEDGADYVDVGAESSRPGATTISAQEEWERMLPVLNYAFRSNQMGRISVDTRKFAVMQLAVDMGASLVNYIGALPETSQLASLFNAKKDLLFLACHIHGTPETMQANPIGPKSALTRVRAYFESAEADLIAAGCKRENIYFDPGIGFGKSDSANIGLLLETQKLAEDFKIALGVSRKGFISRLLGDLSVDARDAASKIIELCSVLGGAQMIRTHNVRPLKNLINALVKFRDEVSS